MWLIPVPMPSQLTYFLSLWISLFWTSHINGITQQVVFCVCFFHATQCFHIHPLS